MSQSEIDQKHMRRCLELAREAAAKGEVPVGAILVKDTVVVAEGLNLRESLRNPVAHAELIAIEHAAEILGRWRLTGCTLYVSLEPCVMCAGAIVLARIDRVVFGTTDPKAGAVGSIYDILSDVRLNHRPEVEGGVCAAEAAQLLTEFFSRRRRENKKGDIT